MAKTPVYMPKFGMTMIEAEIVEWYVEKGQCVKKGDPLLGIETEKTNVDIEAPEDGYVSALLFDQGDSVEVGTILLYILSEPDEQIEEASAPPKEVSAPQAAPAPAAQSAAPLSKMRRTIADNMRASLQGSAQLTLIREECIDALATYKAGKQGISYNDLFLKALALAARQHEKVRAQLTDGGLLIKDVIHLGLAVALENGLVVPVMRDVEHLRLAEIVTERKRLTAAAQSGNLLPGDTANAVATLSNLGLQQIDGFTPILNPPESIILGVGRIRQKPWLKGGSIAPATAITFSLTFDHQVLDGKDAADFLESFVSMLQQPSEYLDK